MDIVILAFLSSLCLAQMVFIIAVLSFLTGMTKILASIQLNPQPEPPRPPAPVLPIAIPTPKAPTQPDEEAPENQKDEGLTLEDFVPNLNQPVKVVIKESDTDQIEEDNG